MRCIAAGNRRSVRFVIIQCRDDVERIEASELRVANIDKFTVEVFRQLRVLVLRVENKYFAVLGGQVGQQTLGSVGLTGTGLADDDHIRVDTFAVAAEEVDKHRHALAAAELDAADIGNMRIDPREACSKRIARNTASLPQHGIMAADLRADVGLHLVKFHVVQPETVFLIVSPDGLLHIGDDRSAGARRLNY